MSLRASQLNEPKGKALLCSQLFLALGNSSFTQGQVACETDHRLFSYCKEFYYLH